MLGYGAVGTMPPSTVNVLPVIQLARGEARNTTSPATSAGSPMRPAGIGRLASVAANTSSTRLARRRGALLRRLLDRLGAHQARHDAVREDAVLREGVGEVLGEVDQRRLGGGVGREIRIGLAADARGDVDDAPAALARA